MKINLDSLTYQTESESIRTKFTDMSGEANASGEIAVIGMACKFPLADNPEELWQNLKQGVDSVREFPRQRRRYGDEYISHQEMYDGSSGYYEGGFLEDADSFDHSFFGISPMESDLMSPNQRVFLEVAHTAIEEAGYGGGRISGSRTGVYLGYSTDFGVSYKEFVAALNPDMSIYAVPGNLNAIIASRLSYILDLKGPCINVDTACSSALAAVHSACLALRTGECEIAVAGTSKFDLLPLISIRDGQDVGVNAPDGRTRTFDYNSHGSGWGEGVGAVVLKPLLKALKDGDVIHAVIKGIAMNQDGASANLTSPNPKAQAEVIQMAWKDGNIDPETISYMEAHGTGTKLGDPIEITAITEAFSAYTDKKQFCAVGSIKSNFGHLDQAAGIAGMIKAILALKYKELPPSLHFTAPNANIEFEKTPVYVNARLQEWNPECGIRRCGISTFGLSGTNCHIVLEEAPKIFVENDAGAESNPTVKLLTLSAQNKEGVLAYLWGYQELLNRQPDINLVHLCYTASTGRYKGIYRLAFVFKDKEGLQNKLESLYLANISSLEEHLSEKEIELISMAETDEDHREELTREAEEIIRELRAEWTEDKLNVLACLYEKGANPDFSGLYAVAARKRVSLPTYPFIRNSHWIKSNLRNEDLGTYSMKEGKYLHPLLHRLAVDSYDRMVYESRLKTEDTWEIKDHVVGGTPLLPGTSYIEMVTEAMKRRYGEVTIEIKDLVFMSPLFLKGDEEATVHTIISTEASDSRKLIIAGRITEEWVIHAEGKVSLVAPESLSVDIEAIKSSCGIGALEEYAYEEGQAIEMSDRWDCVREVYTSGKETIAFLSVKDKYIDEFENYTLYPALLDEAANITLRTVGKGLYLPFSYKRIIVYKPLTPQSYSYIKRKDTQLSGELATFDITLTDTEGNILVLIHDYTIKRVDKSSRENSNSPDVCRMIWTESALHPFHKKYKSNVMLFIGEGDLVRKLYDLSETLKGRHHKLIKLSFETCSAVEDFERVAQQITAYDSCHIVFNTISEKERSLQERLENGVYSLSKLVKAFIPRLSNTIRLTLVGSQAFPVYSEQTDISESNPADAALYGLAMAMPDEYRQLSCRCVDMDTETDISVIAHEILADSPDFKVAYRKNIRYVQKMNKIQLSYDKERPTVIEGGLYVITGGTGALGLLVAEHISTIARVNLLLINRSVFPKEDKWDEITDTVLKDKITGLKKIKERGCGLIIRAASVSHEESMKGILEEARNCFGAVRGIFHAAGVAGNGFLIRRSESQIRDVIEPKTLGTVILDRLTQEDNPDFMILFSSASAIMADAGQCDYAAANSFMDAYAQFGALEGKNITAVNWPAFTETGMALKYGVNIEEEIFHAVLNKEALHILDIVMRSKPDNIIVGKPDISKLFASKKAYTPALSSEFLTWRMPSGKEIGERRIKEQQVDLVGREKFTLTERKVASVIGSVLGLDSVNINDGFIKLGGNSILAVKAEMGMEEKGLPITLADLYAYDSIAALASYIEENNIVKSREITVDAGSSLADNNLLEGVVILKGVEPYTGVYYKSCFYMALFSVLHYFGIDYHPFLMNDVVIYNDHDINGNFNLCGDYIRLETLSNMLYKKGIHFKTKSGRMTGLLHEIRDCLLRGNPVIVNVDCYYEPNIQDCYNKNHTVHCILVYGFNDKEQVFYIVEHRSNESMFYENMKIGYADLEACHEGYLVHFIQVDILESTARETLYRYGKELPLFFELLRHGEEVTQLKDAEEISDTYKKGLAVNMPTIDDSMDKLIKYCKSLDEIVSLEEAFQSEHVKMMEGFSSIVSSMKIRQYQFMHAFPDEEEVQGLQQELSISWDNMRNSVSKYYFTQIYQSKEGEKLKEYMAYIISLEGKLHARLSDLLVNGE